MAKQDFQHNLAALANDASLQEIGKLFRGIEKESLRITPDGHLSQSPHPQNLGATLTHPNITTDYSEALLELITEPHQNIDNLLTQLADTHQFIYQNLGEELLWVNSMPCILGGDLSVPIAQYGCSNIGKMKTVYRHGLWHRYGRLMQAIAGIHFNFSFSQSFWQSWQVLLKNDDNLQDFISAQYFKLIRNFQRHSWILIYLFGASPAVCGSFVKGRQHRLQKLGDLGTWYLPDATSLRMSDLGYKNDAQAGLMICYNSLDAYIDCLDNAIRTPYKPYQDIGIKKNGEYMQLNANILQIENEYYNSIRPKRTTQMEERPTQALKKRGVEYIEVRSLDLNPFEPLGLNKDEILFLDAFLITCLLDSNIDSTPEMLKVCSKNTETVVYEGRSINAQIIDPETKQSENLASSAHKLLDKIAEVSALLDKLNTNNNDQHSYLGSLALQREKVKDPACTPSAILLNTLQKEQCSFYELTLEQARQHKQYFDNRKIDASVIQRMQQLATQSIEEQKKIEANDTVDFDTFVANYFEN